MTVMTVKNNSNQKTGNLDNRYFPRWEVNNLVRYQLAQDREMQEGNTKDISCSGACLCIDQNIDVNADMARKISDALVTTRATANACTKVLLEAQASEVTVVAVASPYLGE